MFFEVGHGGFGGFFKGYRADFGKPCNVLWAALANEARQGMDGSKPLIACGDLNIHAFVRVQGGTGGGYSAQTSSMTS